MEKLSTSKRAAIVRDYLLGMSYKEIAARNHVSTGTVANVVSDLKAGRFPEAGNIGEQLEELKDLSIDLKKANMTPGKCANGLAVLERINQLGLDPADIDRWPLILKSAGNEDEAREFIGLVYDIQEVQKRTGLGLDGLLDKVRKLEEKAAELGPVADKLADAKKQVTELSGQKKELTSQVNHLEEKHKLLTPQVEELKKREKDLSKQVAELEPRAQKAESTLNTLNKEIQKLKGAGFTLEELTEFNGKIKIVAKRHAIKPTELRGRLLHELTTLDKGLGLETMVKTKRAELNQAELALATARKEVSTIKEVISNLETEKAKLEVSIKETREKISQEIIQIPRIVRETTIQLQKELQDAIRGFLSEIRQLRDDSLETGKEVGRYQEILESNVWLKDLLALARGEASIESKQLRAIVLLVLRGTSAWMAARKAKNVTIPGISYSLERLILELERWEA